MKPPSRCFGFEYKQQSPVMHEREEHRFIPVAESVLHALTVEFHVPLAFSSRCRSIQFRKCAIARRFAFCNGRAFIA
jgi:hypothetical protein